MTTVGRQLTTLGEGPTPRVSYVSERHTEKWGGAPGPRLYLLPSQSQGLPSASVITARWLSGGCECRESLNQS